MLKNLQAMAVLRSQNMSVALFALGWTFEKLPPGEEFLQREISFWKKLSPYLYIHGPAKLPFSTNFSQGVSSDVSMLTLVVLLLYLAQFLSTQKLYCTAINNK